MGALGGYGYMSPFYSQPPYLVQPPQQQSAEHQPMGKPQSAMPAIVQDYQKINKEPPLDLMTKPPQSNDALAPPKESAGTGPPSSQNKFMNNYYPYK